MGVAGKHCSAWNAMKAKGVAELGICGVAAAVANAVYNATGVRVWNGGKKPPIRLLFGGTLCTPQR
jgi:CO/xanthine dehydrogenase Mo-binding subunit